MFAVSLEIEIEIETEIDESVGKMLLNSELELTVDSSLIVGEGQVSTGARGVFSTVCGTTPPLIAGGRGGIYVGGAGKRSRRSQKESRRLLDLDL